MLVQFTRTSTREVIAINPAGVAVALDDATRPEAVILRMRDGRGLSVRGNLSQVHEHLRRPDMPVFVRAANREGDGPLHVAVDPEQVDAVFRSDRDEGQTIIRMRVGRGLLVQGPAAAACEALGVEGEVLNPPEPEAAPALRVVPEPEGEDEDELAGEDV